MNIFHISIRIVYMAGVFGDVFLGGGGGRESKVGGGGVGGGGGVLLGCLCYHVLSLQDYTFVFLYKKGEISGLY